MASSTAAEPTRRDFIFIATGAAGAVGVALAAWPFIDQMNPSSAVLRWHHRVDIISPSCSASRSPSNSVGIRCSCAAAHRKSPNDSAVALADLPDPLARNGNLPDDAPATDANRGIHPEYLVLVGVCTHLGCTPTVSTPAGSAGRVWRLALPLPRLAIRYRRPHPQRPRAAEPGRPALFLPHAHAHQSRLTERPHVRSLDLRSEIRPRALDGFASAARALRARHDAELPDAAQPEHLVHLRRHPHVLPGHPDRHRHRAGDALCRQRGHGVRFRRAASCAT